MTQFSPETSAILIYLFIIEDSNRRGDICRWRVLKILRSAWATPRIEDGKVGVRALTGSPRPFSPSPFKNELMNYLNVNDFLFVRFVSHPPPFRVNTGFFALSTCCSRRIIYTLRILPGEKKKVPSKKVGGWLTGHPPSSDGHYRHFYGVFRGLKL